MNPQILSMIANLTVRNSGIACLIRVISKKKKRLRRRNGRMSLTAWTNVLVIFVLYPNVDDSEKDNDREARFLSFCKRFASL
jgi:hypothetical protein